MAQSTPKPPPYFFNIPSSNLDELLSRLASIEILRKSNDLNILQTLKELVTDYYPHGFKYRKFLIGSNNLDGHNLKAVIYLINEIELNSGLQKTTYTGGTSGKKKRATKPKEPKSKSR